MIPNIILTKIPNLLVNMILCMIFDLLPNMIADVSKYASESHSNYDIEGILLISFEIQFQI